MEVPQHLDLDISALEIGDIARLEALQVPDGVTLLDDPETVLASVTHARVEEEPTTEEAPAEGEAAEGEAAAAEPAAEAEAAAEGDGDAEG